LKEGRHDGMSGQVSPDLSDNLETCLGSADERVRCRAQQARAYPDQATRSFMAKKILNAMTNVAKETNLPEAAISYSSNNI
jgi:hypothetical protein